MDFRCATFDELTGADLHDILRLRVAVFVVEQDCPYQEIDGLDPVCSHLLGRESGELVAYLRWYEKDGGLRVGRVVTDASVRGRGFGHALMEECLRRVGHRRIELHAQDHLRAYYEQHGFVAHGDVFDEDGIPHVAMTRRANGG